MNPLSPLSPLSHLAMARASVWAAKRLEAGVRPLSRGPFRPLGEVGARIFERSQAARRPLLIPSFVSAVGVGGSTLGGSYKTPLAIACARALAASAKVVFVGHAYGARPERARAVVANDAIEHVGDEALLAARELAPLGIEVVVAPSREKAIAYAALRGDVLVIDGTTNISGGRSLLRVLSLSADAPWGCGHVFPMGDLRGSPSTLRTGADVLAAVALCDQEVQSDIDVAAHAELVLPPLFFAPVPLRIGVFTAIARPDRFVRQLETLGIEPRIILRAPDHAAPTLGYRAVRVCEQNALDCWLTTAKCALSLGDLWLGAPRHTAALKLALTPTFARRLFLLLDGP